MYAMMASLVFYIIIVEAISRMTGEPEMTQDVDLIRYVFYAVAIGALFMTQVVKALMLRGLAGADMDTVLAKLQSSNIVAAGEGQICSSRSTRLLQSGQNLWEYFIQRILDGRRGASLASSLRFSR